VFKKPTAKAVGFFYETGKRGRGEWGKHRSDHLKAVARDLTMTIVVPTLKDER